jgi:hypothetical protein
LRILPELFPWELILPWATARVRERTTPRPEGADCASGSACAKGADASISRGAGTSDTARSPNASGRSAAGRRHGGRPNNARMPSPKPGMPRLSARAACGPSPRPRLFRNQRLRRRVVTQQNVFFPAFMRPARVPRTTRDLGPKPRPLLLPRLSSGGSQCPRPGTQVALSRHVGWAQEAGPRIQSRAPTPLPAATQHLRPGTIAGAAGVTIPPGRAGRQLSRGP